MAKKNPKQSTRPAVKRGDVVKAHDQSSAKAATIPTATDLGNDIAGLKATVETIKNRRAATKTAAH